MVLQSIQPMPKAYIQHSQVYGSSTPISKDQFSVLISWHCDGLLEGSHLGEKLYTLIHSLRGYSPSSQEKHDSFHDGGRSSWLWQWDYRATCLHNSWWGFRKLRPYIGLGCIEPTRPYPQWLTFSSLALFLRAYPDFQSSTIRWGPSVLNIWACKGHFTFMELHEGA